MKNSETFDRRTVLKLSVGAAAATTLAGCTDAAATHEAWGTVDEILLEARADGWRGVEPEAIAGETNPTLVLYEGHVYDVTARNGDGEAYVLEIRTDDEAVDEEYRTTVIDEEGATRTLTVEGTPRLTAYVGGGDGRSVRGEINVRPERDTDTYELLSRTPREPFS